MTESKGELWWWLLQLLAYSIGQIPWKIRCLDIEWEEKKNTYSVILYKDRGLKSQLVLPLVIITK